MDTSGATGAALWMVRAVLCCVLWIVRRASSFGSGCDRGGRQTDWGVPRRTDWRIWEGTAGRACGGAQLRAVSH